MWSSCPWVSTMATTSSSRSRIEVKSGRITSIPGWWSSGKRTPQSTTKAFGRDVDRVRVEEVLHLNGEYARGVLKSRIAVRDSATSEVMTTAEGNAPHCRGHMDCAEIIRGHATASNVPHVVVRDEQARITHEAAIGTVNRTELETLMARGLDEDDAVDVIIRGMLR